MKPKLTELEKHRRRKERARMSDRRRLDQGFVTREQLQQQNSIIPQEVTESPEWKKTCLEILIHKMAENATRPKITLPPEAYLLNK